MGDGVSAPASLELLGIQKRFGATQALAGADLSLHRGEIHALLGENGAGKSTLVAIAAGFLSPGGGRLLRDGKPISFANPREAALAGIALVPQHDRLVDAATVAENVALLDPSTPFFERPAARRDRVKRIAKRFSLDLGPPDALAAELPVGTRQRIGIAGALLLEPEILILDEPTAVLAPGEASALFASLRERARTGTCVVLITHRIGEVFAAADRLTLLSRGVSVKTCILDDTSPEEIAGLLMGGESRAASAAQPRTPASEASHEAPSSPVPVSAAPALRLDEFRPARSNAPPLSLLVQPGELLVLLAIDGNGADEIASAVAGVRPGHGRIELGGLRIPAGRPRRFREAGGGFIPADRRSEGLVPELSIAENLDLTASTGWLLDRKRSRARAEILALEFRVRGAGPDSSAGQLSGGNQQKLLLARELSREPRLLVAIHPTRGLDIASTGEVQERLRSLVKAGGAALIVTADPEEAQALIGTIRVVYRGTLSSPFPHDVPIEVLGRRMAGLAA
ncbi:MAG: ATP-binding cassette domain-containing protein [Thermoanaerobaculia bacterium]